MSAFSIGEELVGILRQDRARSALQTQVTQLFEECREDVYRYLLTLGLYPPEAQEAAQEVFLRLYTSLKKGRRHPESARLDLPRGAQSWSEGPRAAGHEEAFDPGLEARLTSPAQSPERELLERERMVRFHRAVEGLSEQQQRCLFLRMEGLRYPEIGAALGISASAVGEFLRRAVVRLRKVRDE